MQNYRVYVEKKDGFDVEAKELKQRFRRFSKSLQKLRVLNIYDVFGVDEETLNEAKIKIFAEIQVDNIIDQKHLEDSIKNEVYFATELLPGQFDQRADSAIQCFSLLLGREIKIKSGKLIILEGVEYKDLEKIKDFYINKIEMREKDLTFLEEDTAYEIKDIKILEGFINSTEEDICNVSKDFKLSMNTKDLIFCQQYFKNTLKRDPSETEIRLIDTYWSDHCRHTTFLTNIKNIKFSVDKLNKSMNDSFNNYLKKREYSGRSCKPISLMDMATIIMKDMIKSGKLENLDISEEINACTVKIKVDINGENRDWLLLFKNETHNHPTEIEPFGGAATCLGGAIRDPLSGRAYVYQAMRITGSANPLNGDENKLKGKLSQSVISKGAANGFSSYGNQIGIATSYVKEIYHEGYMAKRMELGAVVAAVPKENVKREAPKAGDLIMIFGGRTGRDGIGGASGSSKVHSQDSIEEASAEVQKGNAPEERKIQRLFRNAEFTSMIKKCNDLGAGGISVGIGELASGIYVDLNTIPLKYSGLNGTEIALSESQERMAVVIANKNRERFIELSKKENVEATVIGWVTSDDMLTMCWNDQKIIKIDRKFLDTNGVTQITDVVLPTFVDNNPFERKVNGNTLGEKFINNLMELNICSQKGLVEMFDSTIGSATVLMPYGGKYQLTENEGSVHKIPVENCETDTASAIAYGYNPDLTEKSPYLGGMYSIVEALSKLVAMGVSYKGYLSMQEYFRRLKTPEDWGLPFSAMLGVIEAQTQFEVAAIGGKDSMSGTFEDINVPSTVVAFAVNTCNAKNVISSEFKKQGNSVYLIKHLPMEDFTPNFNQLKSNYDFILNLIEKKTVLSAMSVKTGGLAETISKMTFGNKIGFKLNVGNAFLEEKLFDLNYGSIVIETSEVIDESETVKLLGVTGGESVKFNNEEISIEYLVNAWNSKLQDLYPIKSKVKTEELEDIIYTSKNIYINSSKIAIPKIAIPVFPGTNCEYDTKKAFEKLGAEGIISIFRNQNPKEINESIEEFAKLIDNSQILMLSGGFSAGDEPDGSGKFISIVLQNKLIKDSIEKLLSRDGLIIGICNGFQALIKSGLLPNGKLGIVNKNSPTLTRNIIGRHVSKIIKTKIVSNISPWFCDVELGSIHNIPISHGEGRFVADNETLEKLLKNGQIATRYVDFKGKPSMDEAFNPNGSMLAIEGITSLDGRILGKMAHTERFGLDLYKNIPEMSEEGIFRSGIKYFK